MNYNLNNNHFTNISNNSSSSNKNTISDKISNDTSLLSANGKGKNHLMRILKQISNKDQHDVYSDWDRYH